LEATGGTLYPLRVEAALDGAPGLARGTIVARTGRRRRR
jgi:hypothetical protein